MISTGVPFGGDKRDRTADLLNAIQALSQLSYTPKKLTLLQNKMSCTEHVLFYHRAMSLSTEKFIFRRENAAA